MPHGAYRDIEKRNASRRAWYAAHRDKENARDRLRYATNLEQQRERQRSYYTGHREEKAKSTRRREEVKRRMTIGSIDYQAIKARDRMICVICGKPVAAKDLSFDHAMPLSFGGFHSQENLRVAHLVCNKRRGSGRLPVQMVLI
jgi:5-methylcytosine-specific restriction endonuclease McrA